MSTAIASLRQTLNTGNAVVLEAMPEQVIAFGRPVFVDKITFVCTTVTVGDYLITVGVRNRDNTGSVNKASFTIPGGTAVNSIVYAGLVPGAAAGSVSAIDQSLIFNGGSAIFVDTDQELFFDSNDGGTSGAGDWYVSFMDHGEAAQGVAATVTAL